MASIRQERRDTLKKKLQEDPFLTDQQLADLFHVSIATIRLDRMALNIPELRERTKEMAETTHSKLRSMQGLEVIGELVQLDLGTKGVSILPIEHDMVFERTKIARGHHLFAQGNSLAVALVNSSMALTASAQVQFQRAVRLEQRVVCTAQVKHREQARFWIDVESRVDQEVVFSGSFVVVDVAHKEVQSP